MKEWGIFYWQQPLTGPGKRMPGAIVVQAENRDSAIFVFGKMYGADFGRDMIYTIVAVEEMT